MKKIGFRFITILAVLASTNLSFSMSSKPPQPSINKYSIVLVHGGFAYGRQEMGGFYYSWGGFTDLQQELRDNNHETFTAEVGPFSSNWDRTCELYAQITGTRVDYGAAHSKKFGHARFGRDYSNKAFCPDWGKAGSGNEKIHLIGHCMGAVTSRMLIQLLENGYSDEIRCFNEDDSENKTISPLFSGGSETKNLVHSLTTVSALSNGTSAVDAFLPNSNWYYDMGMKYYYTISELFPNMVPELFDMKLDQWNIQEKQPEETFAQYLDRVMEILYQEDFGYYEWSPEVSREINGWVKAQPNVYYFSYATEASFKMGDFQYPEIHMFTTQFGPTGASSFAIGRYTCDDCEIPIDETWLQNDGLVNTVNMDGPRLYPEGITPDVITPFDGNDPSTAAKGVWCYRGVLSNVDHFDAVGYDLLGPGISSGFDFVKFYLDIADFVEDLPDN